MKTILAILFVSACATVAPTQTQTIDLHIQLKGSGPMQRKQVSFACDQNAAKMGLPSGTFQVEYINGAGNGLAVLPIAGKSLIFANVPSGSGARYAADKYIWSDGGSRGAFLMIDWLNEHTTTNCHVVN
jgi:membrane-bound inhibitor of C-type lysozyme